MLESNLYSFFGVLACSGRRILLFILIREYYSVQEICVHSSVSGTYAAAAEKVQLNLAIIICASCPGNKQII